MTSKGSRKYCRVIQRSSAITPTIPTVGVGSIAPCRALVVKAHVPPGHRCPEFPATPPQDPPLHSRNCQKFSGLYGLPKFRLSVTASGPAPRCTPGFAPLQLPQSSRPFSRVQRAIKRVAISRSSENFPRLAHGEKPPHPNPAAHKSRPSPCDHIDGRPSFSMRCWGGSAACPGHQNSSDQSPFVRATRFRL